MSARKNFLDLLEEQTFGFSPWGVFVFPISIPVWLFFQRQKIEPTVLRYLLLWARGDERKMFLEMLDHNNYKVTRSQVAACLDSIRRMRYEKRQQRALDAMRKVVAIEILPTAAGSKTVTPCAAE